MGACVLVCLRRPDHDTEQAVLGYLGLSWQFPIKLTWTVVSKKAKVDVIADKYQESLESRA